MNIVIIGCGEIGKRHFESILKLNYKFKIFLVDKSKDTLEKCRQISLKKKKKKSIYFFKSIKEIKDDCDFVIVATDSKHRFSALKELYKYKTPKYLILEKFLFNKIIHFEDAKKLFQLNGSKVWVNQWMSTDFPNLSEIFGRTHKINISVKGENWNICSNSVHWIDWFHHINKRDKIILFKSKFDNLIIKSKRKGFFETFGSLEFHSINKSKLLLQCSYNKNIKRKTLICLSNKTIKAELELTENILKGFVFKSNKKKKISFKIRYLSERTSEFIKSILNNNVCSLPTYDQSIIHHKLIFQKMKNHFNRNKLKKKNYLPVT